MFGKITNEFVNKIIEEVQRQENQEKIKTQLVDPVICYILDRLYPYIFITCAIFILILLIALSILFLIIKSNYY